MAMSGSKRTPYVAGLTYLAGAVVNVEVALVVAGHNGVLQHLRVDQRLLADCARFTSIGMGALPTV